MNLTWYLSAGNFKDENQQVLGKLIHIIYPLSLHKRISRTGPAVVQNINELKR